MTPYEAAIKRTFEMTATTSADWKAVEVTGMVEVDNGKGGATLPSFNFPVGYTPATTPFSHAEKCCHLCGHDIQNAYWIQHDAKRLTMLVGSDCVTHFGEGRTGLAQAKADIRQKIRDSVNELHSLMNRLAEHGQTETTVRSISGFTSTRKQWAGDVGRACAAAYSRINRVVFHSRKSVLPWFGKDVSDRTLANWHAKLVPGQLDEALRVANTALAMPRFQTAQETDHEVHHIAVHH